MKGIIYLLAFVTLASCNKDLSKVVKKHGAKELLIEIEKSNPELLQPREVRVTDTLTRETFVYVPTLDTVVKLAPVDCVPFEYDDEKITIVNDCKELRYRIKSKLQKVKVAVPIDTAVKCPPCITQTALDAFIMQAKADTTESGFNYRTDILKAKQRTFIESLYKYWSWLTWLIILAFVLFRIVKNYGLPLRGKS